MTKNERKILIEKVGNARVTERLYQSTLDFFKKYPKDSDEKMLVRYARMHGRYQREYHTLMDLACDLGITYAEVAEYADEKMAKQLAEAAA